MPTRQYRLEHRDEVRARDAEYRKRKKEYWAAHPDKYAEYLDDQRMKRKQRELRKAKERQ